MFPRSRPVVRELARISPNDLPWGQEGVLVLVSKSLGFLRWQEVESDDSTTRVLMLRDTPLILAESEEYWCPTCEKLLALGWGRDTVDDESLAAIKQVSNDLDAPIQSIVETMTPVLELLEEGIYLLSRVPHSPTNGSGEPFWALGTEPKLLEASKDWYFSDHGLLEFARGYPAFLLPTQPPERCDPKRIDEYRMMLEQGQNLGGLAFWVEGFLSALLDGHHRATASLLEEKPLTCLTIMSPTGLAMSNEETLLMFWDARVPFSSLPREAVRLLEKRWKRKATSHLSQKRAEYTPSSGMETFVDSAAMSAAAEAFPTARGLAACAVAGDTSDSRIDELMSAGASNAPELWAILQALIHSKDTRARQLALRVGRSHWPDLWTDAFRFLATIRDAEVEDFFIEYLIRDEGRHPLLEDIVDEYFARKEMNGLDR